MTSPRTLIWSSATIFSFKMKHPPGRRTSRIVFKVCVAQRPHARRVFDPAGGLEEVGPHERCVPNQLVMNPPYERPATARRLESTNGYFEEAKSTASMRSR